MKTENEQPNGESHAPDHVAKAEARMKKDDVTGQTATTVKEMKARLKEVPHKSAATHHDKHQYEKNAGKKTKKTE